MAPVNSCQHLRGLWTPSGQIREPVIGGFTDARAQMTSVLNLQQLAVSQIQIRLTATIIISVLGLNWPLTKA